MDKKETQVAIKSEVVEDVSKQIEILQKRGKLVLPPNFSAENALMSAWLILQETVDKNKNPVLSSCTRPSTVNSLLDMCIQGLNPAKDQCYFIAYGNKLSCQRSYFGSMAIVKNIAGAKDVLAEVIYVGDVFEYDISHGRKKVLQHTQRFENIDRNKIAGAYCTILFEDGREFTEIMNMDQIRQAWKKSKMDPERDGSTHKEFPERMCKRTVIQRTCKKYINSSSDDAMLLAAFNRGDELSTKEEVATEIEKKANKGKVIDIEKVPAEEEGKEKETEGGGPSEEKPKKKEEVQPTKEEAEMKEEIEEGGEPSDRSPGF